MPISINWGTKVINVPQSYLTLVSGTLYELDTDQFRLDLKDLEDSEAGMPFPDTHRHNTEVTVAGVTYARTIEVINGYSITFEDGQYSVRLVGSNNNFFDVGNYILNQNQVQVIPGNSAGLISFTPDSYFGAQDRTDLQKTRKMVFNPQALSEDGNFITYDDDGKTIFDQQTITDKDGGPIVLESGVPARRNS